MTRLRVHCANLLLALVLASGAQAAVLVGTTTADFWWAPASGPVAGYDVYIARNGAPFSTTADVMVTEPSVRVSGAYGDSISLRVAAFDANGLRGPVSPASESVMLLESEPAPDGDPFVSPDSTTVDSGTDPGTDPTFTSGTQTGSPPQEAKRVEPLSAVADFDGNGREDLAWSDPETGRTELWLSLGQSLEIVELSQSARPGLLLSAAGDFDGDGKGDLLWRDPTSGENVIWLLAGQLEREVVLAPRDPAWYLVGAADQNGDGIDDLLWRRRDGRDVEVWRLRADGAVDVRSYRAAGLDGWITLGLFDQDGDGLPEILWRDPATGDHRFTSLASRTNLRKESLPTLEPRWQTAALGDLDADGLDDAVWHDPISGDVLLWTGLGRGSANGRVVDTTDPGWRLIGTIQHDGEGPREIAWLEVETRTVLLWQLQGGQVVSELDLGSPLP